MRLGLFGSVHLFAKLLRGSRERFGLGSNGFLVVALHHFFSFLERCLNGSLFLGVQMFAVFLHRLVRGMDQ